MDAAPLELGIPRHSGAYGHVGRAYIWVSTSRAILSYEQDLSESILNYPWVKLGD